MNSLALEGLFYKKRNVAFNFFRHRLCNIFKNSLLRDQSSHGTKHLEISPNTALKDLYEAVHNVLKSNDCTSAAIKEWNLAKELISNRFQNVSLSNLKHSDVVYLKQVAGLVTRRTSSTAIDNNAASKLQQIYNQAVMPKINSNFDINLENRNIGTNEKLEWNDESSLSHITGTENPFYATIGRNQDSRYIDSVFFENPAVFERFVNYMTLTGCQRLGILYGTYEINDINSLEDSKACIVDIYEPPQKSDTNSIKLLPDKYINEINEVAEALGLKKIGVIFTDVPNANFANGVRIETHIIQATNLSCNNDVNNTNLYSWLGSSNNEQDSTFISVRITDQKSDELDMDDVITLLHNMMEIEVKDLITVQDTEICNDLFTSKENIENILYKIENLQNNDALLIHNLPNDDILNEISTLLPLKSTFEDIADDKKKPFPVENRNINGHIQHFSALSAYLSQWNSNEFLHAISDFHLLLYLYTMDVLPIKKYMKKLFKAIKTHNTELAYQFKSEEVWKTIEILANTRPKPLR